MSKKKNDITILKIRLHEALKRITQLEGVIKEQDVRMDKLEGRVKDVYYKVAQLQAGGRDD